MKDRNTARLSPCRRYRFALWRTWDASLPRVMFIGLNPSTADETADDPTLVRCKNFARDWGFGGVCMANLFALRASDPRQLQYADDPVGRGNDRWLRRLYGEAGLVVAAWGNGGALLDRAAAVTAFLGPLHCLQRNRSGQPAHPLYQRATAQPVPFTLAASA